MFLPHPWKINHSNFKRLCLQALVVDTLKFYQHLEFTFHLFLMILAHVCSLPILFFLANYGHCLHFFVILAKLFLICSPNQKWIFEHCSYCTILGIWLDQWPQNSNVEHSSGSVSSRAFVCRLVCFAAAIGSRYIGWWRLTPPPPPSSPQQVVGGDIPQQLPG